MLPSRCPHCQAELPKLGRFCVMCGRRVEGWRGLMPAGDLELGHLGPAGPDDRHDSADPEAPQQEVSAQEEQTRPMRPDAATVAASAIDQDEESRKPTGEVPSIGHELRSRAPDQRVHTSPIGNILPSDVLETLDEAIAANSGRARAGGDSSRFGAARSAAGSGPVPRPGSSGRADRTPSSPIRKPGKRDRSGEHGPLDSRAERSGRRRSLKLRTPRREFPTIAPPAVDPSADAANADGHPDRPRRAVNAPLPIGTEPTHFIARRRGNNPQMLKALRNLIWALLWLGLGGMVAFSVVVLYRRSHPPPPVLLNNPLRPAPVAPPRRPPAAPPKATPAAVRPAVPVSAPPPASPTQARDLVVPIPAGARLLGPAAYGPPGLAPASPAVLPAPTARPAPPGPPLDPQQRAAVDQTMSNIEFVVSERVAQVRACYDRAVRSAGPDAPAGRVEVALTLTDAGLVQSVVTVGNTVGSPLLAGCLEQRIAEWHFPRPLGTARTFRLPFTFSPSPEQSGPRPKR